MVINTNLNWMMLSIDSASTKFETLIGYPDLDDVLFIFDRTLDPSWDPKDSVGSIRIDWSLDTYICNFGEEEMIFTDASDAVIWILGKEVE